MNIEEIRKGAVRKSRFSFDSNKTKNLGDKMKTQKEVEEMKERISKRIIEQARKCNNLDHSSMEWYEVDRHYAKLTAQYNILLEVLK